MENLYVVHDSVRGEVEARDRRMQLRASEDLVDEVVAEVGNDQCAVRVYRVAVEDGRLEIVPFTAFFDHSFSGRVFRRPGYGEYVGAARAQYPGNLGKAFAWIQYVFENILSNDDVEMSVGEA